MNETSSAFIAILGRPNVGKSSLLNLLLGEKVAIVTDKPQTTRTRITGVLTRGACQLVFIDTPGFHKPKTKLSEYMNRQVRESVADVDMVLLMTEATGPITQTERELVENIAASGLPAILLVNKVDLLDKKETMLEKLSAFSQLYAFDEVIPISVLQQDGTDLLLAKLQDYAQPGPHFFPDDTLTDQPERVIVAEILREKLLLHLYDEVPHGTAVEIESMKERAGGGLFDIQAVIVCEKASHKGMIIGKGGSMLKKVASDARADIERFLGCRVNLQCWVKIKEDWRNRERELRNYGFVEK